MLLLFKTSNKPNIALFKILGYLQFIWNAIYFISKENWAPIINLQS